MAFSAALKGSLEHRRAQVVVELSDGNDLGEVLSRHLRLVEAMSTEQIITSILLLSADGQRLFHCAAPGLPRSYCEAVDGSLIGPRAGSCGTAAYLGKPIHVSDIATDPLWTDYRHLALPHGLRSCWSTPIWSPAGELLGTFAIYRRNIGGPTPDEVDAINIITEHVGDAILSSRYEQDNCTFSRAAAHLTLLSPIPSASGETIAPASGLSKLACQLQLQAAELERIARNSGSADTGPQLCSTARLTRLLARKLLELDEFVSAECDQGDGG